MVVVGFHVVGLQHQAAKKENLGSAVVRRARKARRAVKHWELKVGVLVEEGWFWLYVCM